MTKRSYHRRDERQPDPKPIRLTERDLAILETVYHCRMLTTQQLQGLFFTSTHQAYARLSALYHHGLLDRQFMGVYTDKMNTPIVYVIDRAGVELLRIERGLELAWSADRKQVSVQFIQHTLAINDIRVRVTQACQQSEGFSLIEWRSESDLKADYDYVTLTQGKGSERVSVIPDSYFILQTPLGQAHFFLELDRGTMTNVRFKTKILAYQKYYQTGAYQARYQTKSLRVLTVTTSQARALNLKETTEGVGGKARYWFTDFEAITPERLFGQPIWWKAAHAGQYRLVDTEA